MRNVFQCFKNRSRILFCLGQSKNLNLNELLDHMSFNVEEYRRSELLFNDGNNVYRGNALGKVVRRLLKEKE